MNKNQLSNEGVQLIQYYESCKLKAYKCSAGVLTIGWGHTGPDVKAGMVITRAKADELFKVDVQRFVDDVNLLLKRPVNQKQFDALVSFAFNVGSDIDADNIAEGLGDSSLLRHVNNGDFAKAADEFLKWDKARVKGVLTRLKGLTKRRTAERALFTGTPVEGAIQRGEAAV